jgi:hypothetical protein
VVEDVSSDVVERLVFGFGERSEGISVGVGKQESGRRLSRKKI